MDGLTTVVYDKWDKGEFGTMNPAQAPNGSWTGTNVVVYRDGMIGPRPGIKIIDQGVPDTLGPLVGLGFTPVGGAGDTPIFFIIGTKVWLFDPDGTSSLVEASAELASAPPDNTIGVVISKESVRSIGSEVYFVVDNDKTYRLNGNTQVLTPIADSAQGTDIETYRDRMMVANGGLRIFYSAAADFSDWPAGNFFDVGPSWRIINMTEFRDSMLIFTASGAWTLTGTATDGTLRRLSDTLPPQDKAVVKTNDDIVYVPSSRSAPVSYNGSYGDERSMQHLESWTSAGRTCFGVQSYGNRDVLFLADNSKLLWRKNGAWSIHSIGQGVGPWITRYFDDNVVLATTGSVSDDPDFYMLATNLDRPAFTSDTWASPGDHSNTPLDASFRLPDYLAPEGKELRVRSVTVDFIKYTTGSATNNNITITVTSQFRELVADDSSITPYVLFNEATTGATAGVRTRKVYRGTPGTWGGGYRITLSDLKGVAIDRVVVEFEQRNSPVN